ncbi:MAG: terminase small subunit [Planctomycetota bacterium]
MIASNGKLTDKQKRFCEEYLVDANATQAAIRAGYSPKTAYSIGEENLKKRTILKNIRHLMAMRSLKTQVTADMVVEELKTIAFAKEGIKVTDKIKALGILSKHVGLFNKPNDKVWELLEEDKKQQIDRIAAHDEKERKALAIMELVSCWDRERLRRALQKRSLGMADDNGENKETELDIMEYIKKTIGETNIRRSINDTLDSLFSTK